MNKYLILSGLSLAAAVSVLGVGKWVQASIPQAAYVTLEAVSAEDDVTCSGRVERTGSSTVTAGCSGLAASVSVQPGDKVHKGQTLAEIAALPEGTSQAEAVETYSALLAGGEPEELGLLETLEMRTLSSPIDGTVTAVSIGENEAVRSGQTAVVISNGDGLQLSLSVNESQIAALRPGQRAEITGAGFAGSVYYGEITSIATGQRAEITGAGFAGSVYYGEITSIAEEATQTLSGAAQETVVEVLVSVENPGADIKPGFSASARIVTMEKQNVLIAPYEAVEADENGEEYVFLYRNGRAVKTPVETGEEYDTGFEILSGCEAGDVLLLSPAGLTDGARVALTSETEAA